MYGRNRGFVFRADSDTGEEQGPMFAETRKRSQSAHVAEAAAAAMQRRRGTSQSNVAAANSQVVSPGGRRGASGASGASGAGAAVGGGGGGVGGGGGGGRTSSSGSSFLTNLADDVLAGRLRGSSMTSLRGAGANTTSRVSRISAASAVSAASSVYSVASNFADLGVGGGAGASGASGGNAQGSGAMRRTESYMRRISDQGRQLLLDTGSDALLRRTPSSVAASQQLRLSRGRSGSKRSSLGERASPPLVDDPPVRRSVTLGQSPQATRAGPWR